MSNKNIGGGDHPNKKAATAADPKSEEAAMAGAKEFMDQQKSIIDELKDIQEFNTKVM